ncbi:type II toxin-antitoxin system YafO family toxin [Hahella sp. HNIBRBA332]|uniref:type II toxin-antitoxin system YafO family toxin n=1 Tax=unclassified Hahella TaxID=2624107 RepID=UPI00352C745B
MKVSVYGTLRELLGERRAAILKAEFTDYKSGKGLPSTFGRDFPYTHSHDSRYVELQHVHYNPKGFPLRLAPIRRTSGQVIVYCPGFYDKDTFLIISIVKHWDPRRPDEIKGTDRDRDVMISLEKIAERFRNKF